MLLPLAFRVKLSANGAVPYELREANVRVDAAPGMLTLYSDRNGKHPLDVVLHGKASVKTVCAARREDWPTAVTVNVRPSSVGDVVNVVSTKSPRRLATTEEITSV